MTSQSHRQGVLASFSRVGIGNTVNFQAEASCGRVDTKVRKLRTMETWLLAESCRSNHRKRPMARTRRRTPAMQSTFRRFFWLGGGVNNIAKANTMSGVAGRRLSDTESVAAARARNPSRNGWSVASVQQPMVAPKNRMAGGRASATSSRGRRSNQQKGSKNNPTRP